MSDLPAPINFGHPGCPAMVRRGEGQWASCTADPTHAALVGRPAVRVFVCPTHLGLPQLRDVTPMSDEDRAELDGRVVQHERALAGLRYERVRPV